MKKRYLPFLTVTAGITLLSTQFPITAFADSSGVPASASSASASSQKQELTQQQALDAAAKLFQIDDSYKLIRATRTDSSTDKLQPYSPYLGTPSATWDFSWTKGDPQTGTNLNVRMNAETGSVLSFYQYTNTPLPPSDNTLSDQQARQTALDWISKLAPDIANQLDQGEVAPKNYPGDSAASIHFSRLVNGIPFNNNGIWMRLSNSGELLSYSSSWSSIDPSSFPSGTAAVSLDEAEHSFANLPLSLQYQFRGGPSDQSQARLVYVPSSGLPVVDAGNGNLVSLNPYSSQSSTVGGSVYSFQPLASVPGAPLITQPLSSKDDAAALAKKLLNLDDSYTLTSSSYGTGADFFGGPYANNTVSSWALTFSKNSNSSNIGASVQVSLNATTGELMHVYGNLPGNSTGAGNGQSLTYDQAVQKAIDFVTKAFPSKLDKLAVNREQRGGMSTNGGPISYGVTFNSLVNGIPVQGPSNLMIYISSATGDVTQVNLNSGNLDLSKYPDPSKAISLDAARAAFVKQFPLELSYVLVPTLDPSTGRFLYNSPPKLAYSPKSSATYQLLDALSGEFISGMMGPEHAVITDIDGHWAKTQLQMLADQGIVLVQNGKVNPDQHLTRKQVLHLFVSYLRNYVHPGYGYGMPGSTSSDTFQQDYEIAKILGWVSKEDKNFRPDDTMTREELADLSARVLGYARLASDTSLFRGRFSDVTETELQFGDIAIVNSLGVMKGDGERNFHPKSEVSLAEAAVVMDRIAKILAAGPAGR